MSLKSRYILIFFASFSLIYFFRLQAKQTFRFKGGERVKIKTRLTQEPIIQDNKQIFKIKDILVKTGRFPQYHYNDYLVITGTLKKRVINRFVVQFWLINPTIIKIKTYSNKNLSLAFIYKLRKKIEKIISSSLPQVHAGLFLGIFLGIKSSLAQDFYQALKTTGTLHIVVASGMNISLTAGLLANFLAPWLSRKPALIIGGLGVVFYCLLAGLNPPIVRAGIMALILYLACFWGREAVGLWLLLITAAIMIIIDPFLPFDLSFQLSFGATAGLMLLTNFFSRFYGKIPLISDDLAETTSALVFTWPILVSAFGQINPLSIIPNALVLWLIPFLMLLGVMISFVGVIFLPLAQVLAWLAWLPLEYFRRIILFFGQFKAFSFQLSDFSWFLGLGYYLILFSLLTVKKPNENH